MSVYCSNSIIRMKVRKLVAQAVLGWNQILHSLQRIDLLRREGFFRAA
jgi:hypothetical protein